MSKHHLEFVECRLDPLMVMEDGSVVLITPELHDKLNEDAAKSGWTTWTPVMEDGKGGVTPVPNWKFGSQPDTSEGTKEKTQSTLSKPSE